MNLHKAAHQWATRPPEERFWTLEDLQTKSQRHRLEALELNAPPTLAVRATDDGDLSLHSPHSGRTALLSNFSFDQLSALAGAPSHYLRRLPAPLASQCLNRGLEGRSEEGKRPLKLLLNQNGDLRLRAITSDQYVRLWNDGIVDRLLELQTEGWKVPPARPQNASAPTRIATERDVLNCRHAHLGVKAGYQIAPAGIYASDRDLFCFMVDDQRPIEAGGTVLYRGFFVENSEVGDRAFRLTAFLFNAVCGNHIVWGCTHLSEARIVHRGQIRAKSAQQFEIELRKYGEAATEHEAQVIESARRRILAENKDDLITKLFRIKLAPKETLEQAYAMAEEHPEDHGHSDPKSAWGFSNGLTRLSQRLEYTSDRVALDRAASQVLAMN